MTNESQQTSLNSKEFFTVLPVVQEIKTTLEVNQIFTYFQIYFTYTLRSIFVG